MVRHSYARHLPVFAAAVGVLLITAPAGASAAQYQSGFKIHSENTTDPSVDGEAGIITIGSGASPTTPEPTQTPVVVTPAIVASLSCGAITTKFDQSMVDFSLDTSKTKQPQDGWTEIFVNGKAITKASEITQSAQSVELKAPGGGSVYRYQRNSATDCLVKDQRFSALGTQVGAVTKTDGSYEDSRIVELAGKLMVEEQTVTAAGSVDKIMRYEVPSQLITTLTKISGTTVPQQISKNSSGTITSYFKNADGSDALVISKVLDKNTTETWSGTGDFAPDGVRPRVAMFDNTGKFFKANGSSMTLAQWNSSKGKSWDGKLYGFEGSVGSFTPRGISS